MQRLLAQTQIRVLAFLGHTKQPQLLLRLTPLQESELDARSDPEPIPHPSSELVAIYQFGSSGIDLA